MSVKSLTESCYLCLLRALVGVLRILPVDAGYLLGWIVGNVAYCILPKRRSIAIDNLGKVYGDRLTPRRKRQLARRALVHFIQDSVVLMSGYALPDEKLNRLVELEGFEKLESAIAEGRGVILASGHLSNFPLAVVRLARAGVSVAVLRRKMSSAPAGRVLDGMCKQAGVTMINRERGAIGTSRWLRKGGVLWLPLDQNARHGVLVEFFGRPATAFPGSVRLARAVGAPILPAFVRRASRGRYVFEIEDPIQLPRGKPTNEELAADLQRLTGILEERILSAPEHWLWAHRRWRSAEEKLAAANRTE